MNREQKSLSILLTQEEAAQGCQKEVFCDGMYGPVQIALQPGVRDGDQLFLEAIPFLGENGIPQYCRLELIIQVKKKKRIGAIIAAAVVASLLLSIFAGVLFINVLINPLRDGMGGLRFYQGDPVDPLQIFVHYEQRYYLSQMDPELQQAAALLYQTAMAFETECRLPKGIDTKEFSQIALLLKAECPELFQLDMGKDLLYSYTTDTNEVYAVELKYTISQTDYTAFRQECDRRVAEILSGTEQMTVWEKEKHIFDMLAMDIWYSLDAQNSSNAYGALISGEAKCDGIALAMKWCLEEAGIQSLCIFGDPRDGDVGHAWNMICLDGKYYNLDLTASVRHENYHNTFMEDLIVYYNYNVADHWMEEDFIVNAAFTALVEKPVCTDDSKSYYVQHGPYIAQSDDLNKSYQALAKQAGETMKPVVFQLETEDDYDQIKRRFMLNNFGFISLTKPYKYEYCLLGSRIIAIYFTAQ